VGAAPRRRSVKERLLAWAMGWAWSLGLRLQLFSWRKEVHGLRHLDDLIAAGRPALAVFWHGKYSPLFALLRGRRGVVFTSLSFRGDVIARICRHFGYLPVQLADRGREESLDLMRRSLVGSEVCGIAVDGPLGPYHLVKRGVVRLASEVGMAVVPVTFAARRSTVNEERWDRFEVPKLFSRVVFVLGEPLCLPSGLWDAELEEVDRWADRLREALDDLDREAGELL